MDTKGLYNKYYVGKVDGTPVDIEAQYLVLRLDKGEYVDACRSAALTFASWVRDQNPLLADELQAFILKMDEADNDVATL